MKRMKELIKQLSEASTAYYKYDKPIITEEQFLAMIK